MAGKLTLPIRPASRTPTRQRPSFRVRRRSAAELVPHMVGRTRTEAYRAPLLQFIADWNRSSTRPAMIEEAPSYEGSDPYLLPSISSVVEALADRHNVGVPGWVAEHIAPKDWVLFCNGEEAGSHLWRREMENAPSTCVHHRVYFHHRLLDKGTPDWWLPWA